MQYMHNIIWTCIVWMCKHSIKQWKYSNFEKSKTYCQTPVSSPDFSLGLGVDFVLPLSQQEQEQEEQPPPKKSNSTRSLTPAQLLYWV